MNKNKIYAFHELGHIHGRKARASIERILKEGLKSVSVLIKEGRLESYTDRYFSFKNDFGGEFFEKHFPFQVPGSPFNREENVFVTPFERMPKRQDFVVIEIDAEEKMYNAFCRDTNNLKEYHRSAIKVSDYLKLKESMERAYLSKNIEEKLSCFDSNEYYPEILKGKHIPSDEILAYARLEKVIHHTKLPFHQEERISKKIDYLFDFCSFFEEGKNAMLYYDRSLGRYELRVIFDKEKALKNKDKISKIFNKINSFKDIYLMAKDKKKNQRKTYLPMYKTKQFTQKSR
ncbi:MAG: hypothetical protein EOM53_02190 [Alphaproteobacteria bacterium]|nr:hypothetical protein [Alphaproteobacteria bacterium]